MVYEYDEPEGYYEDFDTEELHCGWLYRCYDSCVMSPSGWDCVIYDINDADVESHVGVGDCEHGGSIQP